MKRFRKVKNKYNHYTVSFGLANLLANFSYVDFKEAELLNISDKVSLLGFKSNVQDYLFSADLQIISSLAEGFSLAMMEGVFYSKVLISTKVSGCNEILSQSLLFDIKDMTTKIVDVYEKYDTYKKEFLKIKKRYKEDFNIKVCADNYISVFQSIIDLAY